MKVIFPQDNDDLLVGDYRVPISIINPENTNEYHVGVIDTVQHITPMTRFKEGDLVAIKDGVPIPGYVRNMFASQGMMIPRVWMVRHVVSMWALNIMRMIHAGEQVFGIDHASAKLEADGMVAKDFPRALVYAHGFPHAFSPNTATWFVPEVLRKCGLRGSTVTWPHVLDAAKTNFVGWDTGGSALTIDLAPDNYGLGEKLKRPFEHEEGLVHIAATLGMEEAMWRPLDPHAREKPLFHHQGQVIEDDLT